jgi:5-methylcytosine-specific restriction endonuclease McrA
MRSDAKFCSAGCNDKAHRTTRNYRRRMGEDAPVKPRKEPLVNFAAIAERDRWRCHLCGGRVSRSRQHPDPLCASLDHVVPVSRGGTNDPSNLRLAHLRCNCAKGDRARGEQLLLM